MPGVSEGVLPGPERTFLDLCRVIRNPVLAFRGFADNVNGTRE